MRETRRICVLAKVDSGEPVCPNWLLYDFHLRNHTDISEDRRNDNHNLRKHKYRCSSLHWSDTENRVDWGDDVLLDGKRKQSYQKVLFTNVLSFLGKWKYFLRSWTCKGLENKASRYLTLVSCSGFPGSSDGRESAWNAGDPGSILGSGRSPGAGNGNPLQYSCLENSMGGGVWWATIHRVTKSRTRLSGCHYYYFMFRTALGNGARDGKNEGNFWRIWLKCWFACFRSSEGCIEKHSFDLRFRIWSLTHLNSWFGFQVQTSSLIAGIAAGSCPPLASLLSLPWVGSTRGLPRWHSGEEPAGQCRRHRRLGLRPWVRKTPWREWLLTPVFLPGNPMDRGAGWLRSMGSQSWTQLSNWAHTSYINTHIKNRLWVMYMHTF